MCLLVSFVGEDLSAHRRKLVLEWGWCVSLLSGEVAQWSVREGCEESAESKKDNQTVCLGIMSPVWLSRGGSSSSRHNPPSFLHTHTHRWLLWPNQTRWTDYFLPIQLNAERLMVEKIKCPELDALGKNNRLLQAMPENERVISRKQKRKPEN